ncbi:MAG: filamentous hemagglutinin N-terminal domain-containing protein [Nostochopsis sp.]
MKTTASFFTQTNSVRVAQRTCRTFAGSLLGITSLLIISSIVLDGLQTSAQAQVTATPNDAGTVVNQDGNTFNIEGGTKAGSNLFHSFEKFGLNKDQIANFLSKPEIQNILGRVTGGEASVINGLIKVTGSNSNLFLMNPAGIIFGPNASLNVPAAFTATTANGIGFGDKWLNAVGTNDYTSLLGNPDAFAFTQSGAGAIINAGNLGVNSGQNLTLLGGTMISTGTISAPGGKITIAAVPGEKLVRISKEGSVLSLGLPVETKSAINPQAFTPKSLPELLTGGNLDGATGITVENGVVKLTGSGMKIPNIPGTAVISSPIETQGGSVNILASNITVGDITAERFDRPGGGSIILEATGDIRTGKIKTTGSFSSDPNTPDAVKLTSQGGNITVDYIKVSQPGSVDSDFLGNVTIDAFGTFQAQDANFDYPTLNSVTLKAPISIQAPGKITIKHGGNKKFHAGLGLERDSDDNIIFIFNGPGERTGERVLLRDGGSDNGAKFVFQKDGTEVPNNSEVTTISDTNFNPDKISQNTSYTKGAIFIIGNTNAGLYGSYRDGELSRSKNYITIDSRQQPNPKIDLKKIDPTKIEITNTNSTNTNSTNTNSTNTDSTNTDSTNTEDSDKQSTQEQLNQPSQNAACQASNTNLSLIQRLKQARGIAINIPTSNTTDSCEEVIQGFDILRVIRDNRLKSVPGNLKIAPHH